MPDQFSKLSIQMDSASGQVVFNVDGNIPLIQVYALLDAWQKLFLEGKITPGEAVTPKPVPQFTRPAPVA